MNFKIDTHDNTDIIESCLPDNIKYFGSIYSKKEVLNRLNHTLKLKGKIFTVKKVDYECLLTYRPLEYFPGWSLSNLFLLSNKNFYKPNSLGFGYAMDEAVKLGEKNNLNSFFWVVQKKNFLQRQKIGYIDMKKRNSILLNYNFQIVHDSDIHENFPFFDMLTGKSPQCYTILASKSINI